MTPADCGLIRPHPLPRERGLAAPGDFNCMERPPAVPSAAVRRRSHYAVGEPRSWGGALSRRTGQPQHYPEQPQGSQQAVEATATELKADQALRADCRSPPDAADPLRRAGSREKTAF